MLPQTYLPLLNSMYRVNNNVGWGTLLHLLSQLQRGCILFGWHAVYHLVRLFKFASHFLHSCNSHEDRGRERQKRPERRDPIWIVNRLGHAYLGYAAAWMSTRHEHSEYSECMWVYLDFVSFLQNGLQLKLKLNWTQLAAL